MAAVLFFLSLLAHELAHAVVARRNGIRVDGITLWLFGGVAKLLDEARDVAPLDGGAGPARRAVAPARDRHRAAVTAARTGRAFTGSPPSRGSTRPATPPAW